MNNIILQKASEKDAEKLAKLHIKTWQITYQKIIPDEILNKLSIPERIKQWKKWLHSIDSITYIAKHNDDILGFISFGKERDNDFNDVDTAEIYALYVDPDYWQQNIGNLLMSKASHKLQKDGYEVVVLWVIEKNLIARKFYEKNSFAKTIEKKSLNIGNNFAVDEIKYQKNLKNF